MANYTVKKGDTLAAIAKKYGTTYQDIAEANGISNPSLIYPGQTLTIGGNEKPTPASTPAATTPEQPAAPEQTAAPAQTPTQTVTPWTYDPFTVSESTAAADQKRQELSSQKPGDFSYGEYEKSDVVKQAEALLQQQLANKPGEYQSAWQTQLDETLNKILNREKFTYDLNGDALYQQYKDQYMLQGQQAMMDTMGQAAAMTGGYGNSYAQTVGQQTYQGYLQQLNDRIPELYQLALNQYNQEGQDLYNQYGLYADREDQDYGRYRDTVSDYNTELDRLINDSRYQAEQDYGKYMDAYNMAYGQHRDQVSDWQYELGRADEDYWNQYNRDYGQYTDDRNLSYQQNRDQVSDTQWDQSFQYQQDRDQVSDEQWQATFDEGVRQYNESLAEEQRQYDASLAENQRQYNASLQQKQQQQQEEEEEAWEKEVKAAADSDAVKAFIEKMDKETQHWDAVMRHQYGSEKTYIAQQLENSNLTEAEKAYLIGTKYNITESDMNYKKGNS